VPTFETTLSPKKHANQSYSTQIQIHLVETALTNTTLEEALCVFISNISNQSAERVFNQHDTRGSTLWLHIKYIKSISQDSVNQHDTRGSTLCLHIKYIKSISRDSVNQHDTRGSTLCLHIKYEIPVQRLKQRCPRRSSLSYQNQKFTSIRQLFPISNQSAETVVWNNAVPEKSRVYINPSITSNIKSISRDSCLKQRCSREVKSLHQSVNHFQYQINQPRQSFKTTLFPRSQKFTSIRQSLPISNRSVETVV